MSYRERFARLQLLALLVAWGLYFVLVAVGAFEVPRPSPRFLILWSVVVLVHILILGIGRRRLRRECGEEATVPADERDRAINLRAYTFGYHAMYAAIMFLVVLPWMCEGWISVHAAVLSFVLGEAARFALVLRGYRMQSVE